MGAILVREKHPVRMHLVVPVLPIVDRPTIDDHTNAKSKGDWGIMGGDGGDGLTFGGDNGHWFLKTGELQFCGSVAVGSHLVVFMNGEIESAAVDVGKCTDGSVAQVDYELSDQVWKRKQ